MSRPAPTPAWGALETLRRGWRASPELRRGFGFTIALALVGAAGRVTVPVLIQQAIDRGIAEPGGAVDVGLITRLAAVAVVIIVLTSLATRFAIVRLAVRSEHALYGLRSRAFRRIHQLSIADQAEERRGALVSRVTSDVETLSQFFSWGGIAWLVNGALMVAVIATMAVYDWLLTLVVLVVATPLVIVLRLVQKRLVVAYGRVREEVASALSAVSELVMGAATIRAYGARARSTEQVRTALVAQRDAQIRAGELGAYLFPSGELFSVLTVAAVVAIGVAQGPGELTAGALIGFVFLVYRFLEPVAEFTEILDQTQTAVAGWRRVLALMAAPIDVVEPDPGVDLPPGPPSIEVDHVTYVYRPRTVPGLDDHDDGAVPLAPPPVAAPTAALVDVSLRIEAGMALAVVGATGSGKTTLATLLTRLADPTDGVVRVAGIDLRQVRSASLRSTLVMVPQDAFLFDTTIAGNVRFGRPDADDEAVRLAFTELGLDGWLAALPDGLETRVGERGEHLSVGERQLVALARAYVANPACLILDEATSAVDAATEARLARAVESLARGRTSVTIAHRLSTARRADRIAVFDGGRLVELGTHDELVGAGGVYAELHASWLDATAATAPRAATLRT